MLKVIVLWLTILSVGCSVETDPAQYDAAVEYCGEPKDVHAIKFSSTSKEGYINEVVCKNGARFDVFINNFALDNTLNK